MKLKILEIKSLIRYLVFFISGEDETIKFYKNYENDYEKGFKILNSISEETENNLLIVGKNINYCFIFDKKYFSDLA